MKKLNQYKTFNEWGALGRVVTKGEKCTRKKGVAVFHIDQTTPVNISNEPSQLDEYVENEVYKDNWLFH